MKTPLQNILDSCGIMVIDGSMSTALENMGLDLNHRLWTAKALAENPELVKQVHINYFRAGADCGTTCSYQASILVQELRIFRKRGGRPRFAVQSSVSGSSTWWRKRAYCRLPGRALLHGSSWRRSCRRSEYTGSYQVSDDELHRSMPAERSFYGGHADILLFETQPSS